MPHLLRDWMMHRFRSGGAYDWDARSGVLPPGFALTRSGTALGWVNGAYASFATNTPRFEDLDYIGLSGRKGLLIEGARTNRWTGFAAATWSGITVGADVTALGLTGKRLTKSATESWRWFGATAATAIVPKSATTTVAAVVSQGNGTVVGLNFHTSNVYNAKLTFTFATKQLATPSNLGSALQSYGYRELAPGVFMIWMSLNVGDYGSDTADFGICPDYVDGTLNYVDCYYLSADSGIFPSSPIPTSGATVTRNADTCSRNAVLPAAGWTEVLEFTTPASLSAGPELLYFFDGAKEFQVFITSAGVLSLSLTGVGTLVVASLSLSTRYKLAYLVSPGAMRCSLNGVVAIGMGGATFGPAATQAIGNKAGASQLFAHIIKCNASPTRWRAPATDAQLQQLSTLDDLDWDARMGVLPPGFALTRSGTALGWVNGAYASFGTNVPRIEDLDSVSPTLAGRKGLLIEGARTNLLLRSAEYSNASWTKANATVTADQGAAPDGTSAADLIFPSTGSSDCHVTQSVNQSAAVTQYTYSFYVKAAGKPSIWVFVFDQSFGSGPAQYFDVSTGALGTGGQGSGFTRDNSSIQSIGNGWYRCSVTFTTPVTTTTVFCQVNVTDALNSLPVTVSGTNGVLFWGAQLELGAFRTSQVPTAGATATRNAETCSRAVVLPAGGFTVVVEGVTASGIEATGQQYVWRIDDSSDSNMYRIYRTAGSQNLVFRVNSGGGSIWAPIVILGLANSARFKIAARCVAGNFAVCANGGAVQSQASGASPIGLTTERLGIDSVGTSNWFGSILLCNYSPTIWRPPVDDATLQALSALT